MDWRDARIAELEAEVAALTRPLRVEVAIDGRSECMVRYIPAADVEAQEWTPGHGWANGPRVAVRVCRT